MRWIALLLGAALAATYVSPAVGGPDVAGQLKRVDKREKRHYAELDRRLKASVLLALNRRITVRDSSAPLSQSGDGRFFSGTAQCNWDERRTGGGVDWGTTTYGDYHVIYSAPYPNGWSASVHVGNSTAPAKWPLVYAVCVKG